MMKIKIIHIFPSLVFLIVVVFLWRGLSINPHVIPSPFIGKLVPVFKAKTISTQVKTIDQRILMGHLSILHVFATWCKTCIVEQTVLMDLHREFPHIKMIGLSFKDQPNAVLAWLQRYHNPYDEVIDDSSGRIGIDLGVYGTPETFLIDRHGIIRNKWVGTVSADELSKAIKPRQSFFE